MMHSKKNTEIYSYYLHVNVRHINNQIHLQDSLKKYVGKVQNEHLLKSLSLIELQIRLVLTLIENNSSLADLQMSLWWRFSKNDYRKPVKSLHEIHKVCIHKKQIHKFLNLKHGKELIFFWRFTLRKTFASFSVGTKTFLQLPTDFPNLDQTA